MPRTTKLPLLDRLKSWQPGFVQGAKEKIHVVRQDGNSSLCGLVKVGYRSGGGGWAKELPPTVRPSDLCRLCVACFESGTEEPESDRVKNARPRGGNGPAHPSRRANPSIVDGDLPKEPRFVVEGAALSQSASTDASSPAAQQPAQTTQPATPSDPIPLPFREKKRLTAAEAKQQIQEGMLKFLESHTWQDYLKMASKFHRYSFGNRLLIMCQNSNATRVAGMRTWNELGRRVKKGEHAIWINAPMVIDEEEELTETEQAAGVKSKKRSRMVGFKPVPVFDVSQTDGKELPQLSQHAEGDDLQDLYDSLMVAVPIPTTVDALADDNTGGYYHKVEKRIVLNQSRSINERCRVILHEWSHSLMNHEKQLPYDQEELVAESSAYIAAQALGIDIGEQSFPYVAGWSKANPDRVMAVAEEAHRRSEAILKRIEELQNSHKEAV